jgi:hypothetical protein
MFGRSLLWIYSHAVPVACTSAIVANSGCDSQSYRTVSSSRSTECVLISLAR